MNHAMKSILLVEDNPNDAALVVRAFKQSRVMNPVEVVRDGVEALDFLFARGAFSERAAMPFPIVILDLQMPKLDGLSVLKALRSDARTEQLPVLILTSSKEDEDLIASYSLGVTGHLRKSVDFAKLVESVKALGSYWLMIDKSQPEVSES